MRVCVKYFASVREALNLAQEWVDLPADVTTVGLLRDWLMARGAPYAAALARGRALRCALNQVMCDEASVLSLPLGDGSAALANEVEVAFFPPVTGG